MIDFIVLKKRSDDSFVRQCKRVALINKGEFSKALDMITSSTSSKKQQQQQPEEDEQQLLFQKAYCLYRLNRCQEAYDIVCNNASILSGDDDDDSDAMVQHLKAQIEYKMGRYDASAHTYQSISGDRSDIDHDEFLTNLSAALTLDQQYESALKTCKQGSSYELDYNASCATIGLKQYDTSFSLLKQAEAKCRAAGEQDGLDEQEIENDLTAITVQTACVKQLTGDVDGALQIYNEILSRKKTSDDVARVVAMNNSLAIHSLRKDDESKKSLFDVEKKLKLATQDKVKDKLTTQQKTGLDLNLTLLYIQMNKLSEARSKIQLIAQQMPSDSQIPVILESALLLKEKKPKESVAVLQQFLNRHGDSGNDHVLLTLAQIYLDLSDWANAATILQRTSVRTNPSIVRLLTDMYKKTGDSKSQLNVLSTAIKYWQQEYERSKNEETKSKLVSTCLASAKLQEEQRKHREAAQTYKTLAELDRNRSTEFYARMVNAMTYYDMEEAEKHLAQLPAVPTDHLNVEELVANKTNPFGDYQQKANVEVKQADAKKKNPKKKRKNKPPKDTSKPIDPNRWISKKVKKQPTGKTATGFGTQGSSEGKEALQHEKGQKTIHKPSEVLGARVSKAAAKKGKGKGKGKR